jgi:hypothetical protein
MHFVSSTQVKLHRVLANTVRVLRLGLHILSHAVRHRT